MEHVNGNYTVNGKEVSLTFEQEHNGYFGAITSGLESLKETGIEVKDVAGIPTESASASNDENKIENGNGYSDQLNEWIKDMPPYPDKMRDTASTEEWNWN